MSLIYHSVEPENYRPDYKEHQLIDFVLNYPQRKLVNSSIRISADLKLTQATGGIGASIDVASMNTFIDPQVGAHCFFDTITTSFPSKFGTVENIVNYPRWVKVRSIARLSPLDMFEAQKVAELRSPTQYISKEVIKGVATNRVTNTATGQKQNFSVKPDICLNSMASQGDNRLSFRKSGAIRISVRLAPNAECFFGPDATDLNAGGVQVGQVRYSLTNVRLHFETNPDDGKDSGIVMPNIVNVKTSVNSTYQNLALTAPVSARGFVATFIKQSEETNPIFNNLACQNLPSLSKLTYLYNNATTNAQITYQITDTQEVLNRFTEAISSSYHNMVPLQNQWHDKAFGIGLSAVTNTDPYTVNMFFLGVMSL